MLPAHDTAYAATVHQAQGSEFAEVLFLLPLQDNRILCRELVYTGLTRARHMLTLADPASLLADAVCRRAVRYSGLTERLWGKEGEGSHPICGPTAFEQGETISGRAALDTDPDPE